MSSASSSNPDAPAADASSRLRLVRRAADTLGPLAVLAVVLIGFGLIEGRMKAEQGLTPTFLTVKNIRNMSEQTVVVAVAALGMTLIIISRGIDLAAGTSLALSAVVTAWCFREGYAMPWPIVAAVGIGGLVGLINGSIISLLGMRPFIVTLGMMTVVQGTAKLIARETTVEASKGVPEWLLNLVFSSGTQPWLVYPVLPNFAMGVWLLAAMAVALSIMLRYTVFGRYVFAVGSNEATARLCGINVKAVKIVVYTLAGLFIGAAGVMQFTKLSSGDPTGGVGLELRIIAAVVIGGGSLNGGRGSVLGTVAGAALMVVISSGCNFIQISNSVQDIVIGAIIVIAVWLDKLRHGRAEE